jgi:hypothetical protein
MIMKNLLRLSLILVLFYSGSLWAQSEYWAAKEISGKNWDAVTIKNQLIKIIPIYNDVDQGHLLDAIKYYFPDSNFSNSNAIKSAEHIMGSLTSPTSDASSQAGFGISSFADGMARFLVERTKEELSASLFNKLSQVISENAFIQELFPQTHLLLSSLSEQIYNYPSYIHSLRAAFINDLDAIGFKITPFLLNTKYFQIEHRIQPFLKDLLLLANDTIERIIISTDHPGKIIEEINLKRLDNYPQLKIIVKSIQILSGSLRNCNNSSINPDKKYWIDQKDLIAFFWNDSNSLRNIKIYLGLILLRLEVIEKEKVEDYNSILYNLGEIYKDLNNPEKMGSPNNRGDKFISSFKNICLRASAIDSALLRINELKSDPKPGESVTFDDYYRLYESVIGLLDCLPQLSHAMKPDTDLNLTRFLVTARALGNIALAIKQKNYYTIGAQIVLIIDNVFTLKESEKEKFVAFKNSLKEKLRSLKNSNLPDKEIICKMKADLEKCEIAIANFLSNGENTFKNIKSLIARYAPLICSIAMAENTTQIKEAIEAVALPAGASNIKKSSQFSLALNAYVGGSWGAEWMKSELTHPFHVFAPIGLAFSVGGMNGSGSFSLFFSIVDLGALVSYRFPNDESQGTAQFLLKNILSPGVYGVIGMPNIPISIGVGLSRRPQLSNISETSTSIEDRRWWFGIFIAVDIPLINFWCDYRK